MKGILKEKSEIEKLKKEYQTLTELNFEIEKSVEKTEELILEECEL